MRVLMVSKACVVGAYQRKLEEIARLGVDLTVVVPPYWQEESRRIPLEPLHTEGYRLVVEPVRFNGRFHLFHFPGLAARVREVRPDILHADEEPFNPATWHMLRLARAAGARSLFFTWQNLYRRYMPPFSWMERYCFDVAGRAIAGNKEAIDVLRRKGFRGPVDVIPQFGVDPEIFRPGDGSSATGPESWVLGAEMTDQHSALSTRDSAQSSVISHQSAPFRVGFVGRLVEQKGLMDLVEAAARFRDGFTLVLVGAGPLQARLEARARELGIARNLEIKGGVPSARMPEIYRSLDALVLPSRTRPNWKEQFGRALVEAMACGVPVIGSYSGEIPNVIGDAGLVFPEGDVARLATQLARLRDSEELRRELGAKGRERVLARFTQASVAEQTVRVYREMLGG